MKLKTLFALSMATCFLTGSAWAEHEGKGKFHSTKHSIRVGQFLGASVVDQTGQSIGQLKDIVMHPESGKADFAIISLSLPNQTDKLTAVPWQLVRVTEPNRLMLSTDREKLMSATTFETSRWPEFDMAYNQRVYTHYGLTYPVAVGGGVRFEGETRGPAVTTKEHEGFPRPQPDGRETFPELNKDPEKERNN